MGSNGCVWLRGRQWLLPATFTTEMCQQDYPVFTSRLFTHRDGRCLLALQDEWSVASFFFLLLSTSARPQFNKVIRVSGGKMMCHLEFDTYLGKRLTVDVGGSLQKQAARRSLFEGSSQCPVFELQMFHGSSWCGNQRRVALNFLPSLLLFSINVKRQWCKT